MRWRGTLASLWLLPALAGAVSVPPPDAAYQAGLQALAADTPSRAIPFFEQVLLTQPDHAGAWLDLVLAHARLGDLESARTLLAGFQARFPQASLPAAFRDALQREIARHGERDGWQLSALLQVGHATNINDGTSATSFLLTPVNLGAIDVRVSDDNRPRPDAVARLSLQASRTRLQADGGVTQTQAFLVNRTAASEHALDYTDLGGAWQRLFPWQGPGLPGLHVQAGVRGRHLQLGDRAVSDSLMPHLGVLLVGACSVGARLELERRFDYRSGYRHATVPWLQAQAGCLLGPHSLQLQHRHGEDRPDGQRIGGLWRRSEWLLPYRYQLASDWRLEASLSLARQADNEGYSELLNFGEPRVLNRRFTQAGVVWAPTTGPWAGWQLRLDLERLQERSNLALFNQQGTTVWLGVGRQFSPL